MKIPLRHALILIIWACVNDPVGPSAEERAVTASWAGDTLGFSIALNVHADKTYFGESRITAGPILSRESGTWRVFSGRFYMRGITCEEAPNSGAPLVLIACNGEDSIAVNISNGIWTMNFQDSAGAVLTLFLQRI